MKRVVQIHIAAVLTSLPTVIWERGADFSLHFPSQPLSALCRLQSTKPLFSTCPLSHLDAVFGISSSVEYLYWEHFAIKTFVKRTALKSQSREWFPKETAEFGRVTLKLHLFAPAHFSKAGANFLSHHRNTVSLISLLGVQIMLNCC